MNKRITLGLVLLGLAAAGVYRMRRQWVARLLGLPPARYDAGVERDIRVPMPDGVHLMTDHYFPKAGGRLPAILIRSTYGRGYDVGVPFGLLMSFIGKVLAERGYHVLAQTTRGRFDSEGETEPFVDAAPDGQAAIEWITYQPWSDGNVGMWGGSYLGYVQWAAASQPEKAPALKAIVPSIIGSQVTSLAYPDGAFGLDTFLRWIFLLDVLDHLRKRPGLEGLRRANPRIIGRYLVPAFQHLPIAEADIAAVGYPISFYREWLAHPDPNDPYWQRVNHHAGVPRVSAAAHLVGGWYDLCLRGTLDDYAALRAAGRAPYLTIGTWAHTDLGNFVVALREGLIWFDAHLKGDRRRLRERPVRIYVMGANPKGRSGQWREMDAWPPPARATRYFLHANGRLSIEAPQADALPDHYRYDPADPTPSVGGPLLMPPSGPVDNRALEARPDVLTYTTPPLANDVEAIGPVRLELYARSSLAHTDFFGRLCDVHPDGRSINICDGLFRVEPGGSAAVQIDGSWRIEVDMWATAHRFRRGHRIRLQVSSGAHPRWSRNLGTGEPIGTGTRMAAAEQTIYHDRAHPSALVLPLSAD